MIYQDHQGNLVLDDFRRKTAKPKGIYNQMRADLPDGKPKETFAESFKGPKGKDGKRDGSKADLGKAVEFYNKNNTAKKEYSVDDVNKKLLEESTEGLSGVQKEKGKKEEAEKEKSDSSTTKGKQQLKTDDSGNIRSERQRKGLSALTGLFIDFLGDEQGARQTYPSLEREGERVKPSTYFAYPEVRRPEYVRDMKRYRERYVLGSDGKMDPGSKFFTWLKTHGKEKAKGKGKQFLDDLIDKLEAGDIPSGRHLEKFVSGEISGKGTDEKKLSEQAAEKTKKRIKKKQKKKEKVKKKEKEKEEKKQKEEKKKEEINEELESISEELSGYRTDIEDIDKNLETIEEEKAVLVAERAKKKKKSDAPDRASIKRKIDLKDKNIKNLKSERSNLSKKVTALKNSRKKLKKQQESAESKKKPSSGKSQKSQKYQKYVDRHKRKQQKKKKASILLKYASRTANPVSFLCNFYKMLSPKNKVASSSFPSRNEYRKIAGALAKSIYKRSLQ